MNFDRTSTAYNAKSLGVMAYPDFYNNPAIFSASSTFG